jgi:predicted transposase YbfD/YdcC
MEYSTLEPWQEISETGIVYTLGSLYDHFQRMSDPRKAKGKRYSLGTLLVLIFLAKLCNQDTPVAIADWAKNHAEELTKLLNLRHSWMPHHNTYRRVFQDIISEVEFGQLMEKYHQQRRDQIGEILAMDGKTLRGTRIADRQSGEHVLSVYDGQSQRVLAQEPVGNKENEIVAAPQALERVPLAGKIVTGDAMHTQRAISAFIVEQGGDYVWPVKENQERLYQDIQRLFAPDHPKPGFGKISTDFQSITKVNAGHGRIEKRTLQASEMLNDYLDWPGVGQVYRLERRFIWLRQGQAYKTSGEVEFGITSLPRKKAPPAKLLSVRRQHWLIETGLHYRRDVTFHEDATRMTKRAAGRILAMVHNLVLGLLKSAGFINSAQGRRWFAGHLQEAFALLIAGDPLS